MQMKFLCPLLFLFVAPLSLNAQTLLSLSDALSQALDKNYDIQIAHNEVIAAQASDYYGNAAEHPFYSLTASENGQLTGVNQKLASGNEISRIGVPSHAFATQLGVAYPIFNRFRVSATKGRIREQINATNYRAAAQMQNTLAQVSIRYYDIVRQQKLLKSLQKTLDVSEKRLELVKVRQSVGMANNTDLYLAELDLNTRKQEIVAQDLALRQNKTDLNTLLARDKNMNFSVSDTIIIAQNLDYEELLASAKKNPDAMFAESQVNTMDWMEKEVHAQRLPTARLTGGVAANISNTTAGFILQNANYGPFVGASVSIPLFNKGIFNKQEEIVALQRNTRQTQANSLQNTIEGNMYRTWQAYQTFQGRIISETANIGIAQQYLSLVFQRYTLNQSNAIELREAQRSYEEASFRLTSVQYATKVAEIELLRLAAKIVVEK
jgi:outer membrane protein TolC